MGEIISLDERSKLQHALAYARIGWSVFPVWPITPDGGCACGHDKCANAGKHPIPHLVQNGQLSATNDEATIRRWWSARPDANIGLNLRMSGLCVVDVDPRNGGNETLEMLEARHGPFYSDVCQHSGSGDGRHFVYERPESTAGLPHSLGPGVDFLLNNYIIVEPSNHKSGGTYEWEASSSPLDGNAPAPMPDWIRDLGSGRAAETAPRVETGIRYADEQQLDDLWAAMQSLDADDRDVWVKVAMALRELGPDGLAMWDKWSQSSPKYKPGECSRKWATDIKPGAGLHFESIWGMAQECGWVNPRSKAAEEDDSVFAGIDLSDISPCRSPDPPDDAIEDYDGLEVWRADRIPPEHVHWLWPGYIARGKINVLAGDPGCGKTMLSCSLIASVTSGAPFADGEIPEITDVLMFTTEDDIKDTLVPRLYAANAGLSRVRFIKGDHDPKTGRRKPFDPKTGLPKIVKMYKEHPFGLLILDSLADCIKGDSHKNEEVRAGMDVLREMAEHCGFAVLGIMHQSKGSIGQKAQNRVLGSVGFVGKARLVMNATRGENGADSVLAVSKANNTSIDKGFYYRMEEVSFDYNDDTFKCMRIQWGGQIDDGALNALNAAEGIVEKPDNVRQRAASCVDWLREYMSDGMAHLSKEIDEDAALNGYTETQVRRARDKLKTDGVIQWRKRLGDRLIEWVLADQ